MDPKQINQTSFCNKKIDNIVSNTLKEYILDDLALRTSLKPISQYIDKQGNTKKFFHRYASFYNPEFSNNLVINPHICCLKTYGEPYFLYFTKINMVNYALLIHKKIKIGHNYPKMFIVQYRFNDDIYDGTLYESELLRDNDNEWKLLLADLYFYKGKLMKDTCIIDRINMIHKSLDTEYIDETFSDICPFEIKKYFEVENTENILSTFVPKLNYKIRGLYFVPININFKNVLYMFSDDELSVNYVKNDDKNILNFKITKTTKPEIYELHLNSHDTLSKIGYAYIKNIIHSKYINDLFNKDNKDIIVECEYNKQFEKWQPIKSTTQRIHHVNDLKSI